MPINMNEELMQFKISEEKRTEKIKQTLLPQKKV